VLLFLDDWHAGEHLLSELQAYAPFVGADGLLVVADTSFYRSGWHSGGAFPFAAGFQPRTAIESFLKSTPEFERTSE
jgi:cephalosporin hydroxylase